MVVREFYQSLSVTHQQQTGLVTVLRYLVGYELCCITDAIVVQTLVGMVIAHNAQALGTTVDFNLEE